MRQVLAWISLLWLPLAQAQENVCANVTLDRLTAKAHVSLVYASQNLESPVSMFGHVFLVFHDSPAPEPDAITLEYIGVTRDQPSPVFRALVGTLPGQFHLNCFYYKQSEYDVENRDLWLYPMRLSAAERLRVNEQAIAAVKLPGAYSFARENCGRNLYSLLMQALGLSPKLDFVHVPITGVRDLHRRGKIELPGRYIASSLKRLRDEYGRLDSAEQNLFQLATEGVTVPKEARRVRSALGRFANFQLRREPDVSKRKNLFLLKQAAEAAPSEGAAPLDPLLTSARFSLQLGSYPALESTHLTFSPGIQDFWNNPGGKLASSVLEFLKLEASLQRGRLDLRRFRVFGFDSMIGGDRFASPLARFIDLEYSDQSDLLGDTQRQYELRAGGGWATSFGESVDFSVMPVFSAGHYASVERSGLGGEISLRASVFWQAPLRSRISVEVEHFLFPKRGYHDFARAQAVFLQIDSWNLGATMSVFDYRRVATGLVTSFSF